MSRSWSCGYPLQHQYGREPKAIITSHDYYQDPLNFQSRKSMLSVLSDVPQYPNNLRTFNSKATYQEGDDHDALHKNHSKNLTPRFLEKLEDEEANDHIKKKNKDRKLAIRWVEWHEASFGSLEEAQGFCLLSHELSK